MKKSHACAWNRSRALVAAEVRRAYLATYATLRFVEGAFVNIVFNTLNVLTYHENESQGRNTAQRSDGVERSTEY